jgi:hypothetical protein
MFNVKKMKKYLKYEVKNLLDELFVSCFYEIGLH